MGWLSIIGLIIQYGPGIIHLVTEIIELIKKMRESGKKSQATFAEASLTNALTHYKKTKDRRLLNALRERLHTDCYGTDCPAA